MKKTVIFLSVAALMCCGAVARSAMDNSPGEKTHETVYRLASKPSRQSPSKFIPMEYGSSYGNRLKSPIRNGLIFNTPPNKEDVNETNSLTFIANINEPASLITPGIYKISTSGRYTMLAESANNAKGGGVLAGDTYYTIANTNLWGMTYVQGQNWDPATWTKKQSYGWSLGLNYLATDVTYDPTTGTIYGCYYNEGGNGYEFGTAIYDMNSKERTTICELEYPLNALASDNSGNMYGIDMQGNLQKIDKETGSMTLVGATGFTPKYVSSGCIDKKTGRMYWVVAPEQGGSFLCRVDLATGAGTKICDFPNGIQITGMIFPDDMAHPDAPAAVEDLEINFQEGNLAGNVDFTMPGTRYDGEPLADNLRYRIYLDGEKIKEENAQAGEQVSVPITVGTADNHDFEIVAVNSVGEGPSAKRSVFIGTDTPVTPTEIMVEHRDGAFHVSWNPEIESTNGGYIDREKITYNLYRMPENVAVAEGGTATSYVDEFDVPEALTTYWYSMEILYDGMVCGTALSAHYTLGNIIPPYLNTFDDDASLDGFTIIDANNDRRKWYILNGEAAVSFNDNTAKDDWLVTPGIRFEKGKVYKFSVDVRANVDFYPEKVNVMMGREPSVEGLSEVVVADTTVLSTYTTLSEYIRVEESGIYYIAVHAIQDAGPSMFRADNLTVSAAIDGMTPEAISDLSVEATSYRSARLSFQAPAKNALGDDLESLDKIYIYRNGELVKSITSPEPGSEIEYIDNVEEGGTYTYRVECENYFGVGAAVEKVIYVGVPKPYRPGVVTVTEPSPGIVNFSWEPSAADEEGNPIDEQYMRYYVVKLEGEDQIIIGDKVEGTTFSYVAMENPAYQEFMQFAVFAVTEGGVSMGVVSEMIPVGLAYTVPYRESFTDLEMSGIWGTAISSGEADWGLYSDTAIEDVTSVDFDNGFIGMRGKQGGEVAMLYSGKIDLGDAPNPVLVFSTYNIGGKDENGNSLPVDMNDIQVFINDGQGWGDPVISSTVNDLCNGELGWSPVMVDLSQYKGKNIQVGFICSARIYLFTLLDGIRIISPEDFDVNAMRLKSPKFTEAGKTFNLRGVVENAGKLDAENLTVVLERNGKDIAFDKVEKIGFGKYHESLFSDVLNGCDPMNSIYNIRVDYDADMNQDNNRSETADVMMKYLPNPAVRNLTGKEVTPGSVLLEWEEPDYSSAAPADKSDGFEDYDSWANSHVGDWKFHDIDKGKIGSLNYINLPNIPTGSQQSFWVMDDTLEEIQNYGMKWRYLANSGHKYLAQAFVAEQVQCDDWAVSPELYGGMQNVSFFAKSFLGGMAETFEFLISDSGDNPEDFELMERCEKVPDTWTEYSFNLPEGTKYFAIRCVSQDRFMFFVDDVTYIPQGASRDLQLEGYNIYLDGEKLNFNPAGECTFSHRPETSEGWGGKYSVTAVYDSGESYSEDVTVSLSGIRDVSADPAVVYVKNHCIVIRNVDGRKAAVYSADGICHYSSEHGGDVMLPMSSGIYIVKVGETTVRVVLR